jgi:hypothetical protein
LNSASHWVFSICVPGRNEIVTCDVGVLSVAFGWGQKEASAIVVTDGFPATATLEPTATATAAPTTAAWKVERKMKRKNGISFFPVINALKK